MGELGTDMEARDTFLSYLTVAHSLMYSWRATYNQRLGEEWLDNVARFVYGSIFNIGKKKSYKVISSLNPSFNA